MVIKAPPGNNGNYPIDDKQYYNGTLRDNSHSAADLHSGKNHIHTKMMINRESMIKRMKSIKG